ncbi:DUF177 domain-containing protein [bacterium]|nr:DUF177 domain-containing protein [bacterium]
MNKILIEDIEKEPNKTLFYEFDEFMEEFGADIFADLELKSLGQFIEVSGNIQGKLKLVCDRCLNEFVYDLNIEIDETFAKYSLQDEYSQEFELQRGQFVTDLNGEKEIDIYDLLYQSVILALPNKKVCGINCSEDMFMSDENYHVQDSRMDVFKNIQIERKD